MSEGLSIALVGLIGVAFGASLQAWLAHWTGTRQQIRQERFEAYQAFWSAISRDFIDSKFEWHKIRRDEELRRACFEIGIYGSKNVIRQVTTLITGEGIEGREFDQLRLYEVIRAMRKDLSGLSDRGIKTDIYVTMSAGTLGNFLDPNDDTEESE